MIHLLRPGLVVAHGSESASTVSIRQKRVSPVGERAIDPTKPLPPPNEPLLGDNAVVIRESPSARFRAARSECRLGAE
jgi:hypothetical protein